MMLHAQSLERAALRPHILQSARGPSVSIGAYAVACLVLDRVSMVQMQPDIEFALWNPVPACSLLLLLAKGLHYAPVLFVVGVLSDWWIDKFSLGALSTVITEAIIAGAYTAIALAVRRVAGMTRDFGGVQTVLSLLAVACAGILAMATIVTAILVVVGEVPGGRFVATVRHFWIGDLGGVVGLLPALFLAPRAWERWKELSRRSRLIDTAIFAVGLVLAMWIVFGLTTAHAFQFFYLLVLPVVWIGVRHGLPWCSFAILVEQLALIAVVTLLNYSTADFVAFQVVMLVIASTGLVLGAVVSERQLAEICLRRQQAELDRIGRLTTAGALGSAIVHEISQPFATIATYSHVCRRLLRSEPEVVAATLEKMETEVLRVGEIVDRLRDFLSKGDTRLAPIDLADVARRIVAALADEARLRGVCVSLDAHLVPKIPADRIQMEQVLVNLLRNAIDAAAEGARSDSSVRVSIDQSADGIEVSFEDSGPGVAPDIAERLFEPFETSKSRGMGLGLSLSRRMVEGHGGSLWWDPSFPAGARFVFRIPAKGLPSHGP